VWARCRTAARDPQMNLPRLWTTSQELTSDPFRTMRREMENALRAFDQNLSSAGAKLWLILPIDVSAIRARGRSVDAHFDKGVLYRTIKKPAN
jgi:hypothetical protein